MVYRFAERLAPNFKKASQPERVTINWRYSGNDGLPLGPERESMDTFEDLVEGLTSDTATLVLVSTGNNRRQWVYYTQSAALFVEAVRKVQTKTRGSSLEFESAVDPTWISIDSFVRSIRR